MTGNKIIPNNLRSDIFRSQIETKNQLQDSGDLYVGSGEQGNYEIFETKKLSIPSGVSNALLMCKNSDIAWVDKISNISILSNIDFIKKGKLQANNVKINIEKNAGKYHFSFDGSVNKAAEADYAENILSADAHVKIYNRKFTNLNSQCLWIPCQDSQYYTEGGSINLPALAKGKMSVQCYTTKVVEGNTRVGIINAPTNGRYWFSYIKSAHTTYGPSEQPAPIPDAQSGIALAGQAIADNFRWSSTIYSQVECIIIFYGRIE